MPEEEKGFRKQQWQELEEKKEKKGGSTSANAASVELKSEVAKTAQITCTFNKFPSHSNDDIHIFVILDVVALLSQESKDETYIDSDCSHHLSPCHQLFLDTIYIALNQLRYILAMP
jgi:hypothetical protein